MYKHTNSLKRRFTVNTSRYQTNKAKLNRRHKLCMYKHSYLIIISKYIFIILLLIYKQTGREKQT
ncbi:hypothetical protein SAMN04488522_10517 [Pedobacter caeni]|uniref:Uncharacterized protein n=1 Tax=Pedobacter caeni TaxID=288992 RepID=A0A1M5IQ60_9SPHI|nr:hypothetical protein SAMN04488522_10517 [Pedobacter caeni]